MTTRVATLNMRNTAHPFKVTRDQARSGLLKTLATNGGVSLIGLQEWAGSERNGILRELGPATFVPTLRRLLGVKDRKALQGYGWVRPALGGPWVGYQAARYVPRFVRAKTLAPAGRLEKVPGFRSLMGPSVVTVAGFTDLETRGTVVVINGHLTRHVETGGHYRKDLPRTTSRHKREVAALERVIRYHRKRGRVVYVTIDGNYDGLELAGVVPCWRSHPRSETGGTLGPKRRPDVVYGPRLALGVTIVRTASDHDAVVAEWTARP